MRADIKMLSARQIDADSFDAIPEKCTGTYYAVGSFLTSHVRASRGPPSAYSGMIVIAFAL